MYSVKGIAGLSAAFFAKGGWEYNTSGMSASAGGYQNRIENEKKLCLSTAHLIKVFFLPEHASLSLVSQRSQLLLDWIKRKTKCLVDHQII